MTALHQFLSGTKARFIAGPSEPQSAAIACIGNIAGDLDSIVSAVCLAFVQSLLEPLVQHVPLVPFARDDFRLRQDADMLFRHCDFSMDSAGSVTDLIYLDEAAAPASAWRAGDSLGVALTDHNRIAPHVEEMIGNQILSIYDHHADEAAHIASTTCSPVGSKPGLAGARRVRLIDTAAGSACSLIVNAFSEQLGLAPPALFVLLLGTIATDTRGFDETELKYSVADLQATQRLLRALGSDEPAAAQCIPVDAPAAAVKELALALRATLLPAVAAVGGAATIAELGKVLLHARYDVSSLTAYDLLRLDYKQAAVGGMQLGCCAIFCPMPELVTRAGGAEALAEQMRKFSRSVGADVLLSISKEDPASGLKGFAVLAAHPAATPKAAALRRAIGHSPAGLPADLLGQPLFVKQRIPQLGFGIAFPAEGSPSALAADELHISELRADITRKTLMPAALFLADAPPQSSGL